MFRERSRPSSCCHWTAGKLGDSVPAAMCDWHIADHHTHRYKQSVDLYTNTEGLSINPFTGPSASSAWMNLLAKIPLNLPMVCEGSKHLLWWRGLYEALKQSLAFLFDEEINKRLRRLNCWWQLSACGSYCWPPFRTVITRTQLHLVLCFSNNLAMRRLWACKMHFSIFFLTQKNLNKHWHKYQAT